MTKEMNLKMTMMSTMMMPKAVMMTTRRMSMKTTMIMITSDRTRDTVVHPVAEEEVLAVCLEGVPRG
jgi:hypothetical protein